MDTYQGKCKYCGKEQLIMAESQEEADRMIAESCECKGASIEEKTVKLMERISYISDGEFSPFFTKLSEEQRKMLRLFGQQIVIENANVITVDVGDSKIKIWSDGEKFKVNRIITRKEEAEA